MCQYNGSININIKNSSLKSILLLESPSLTSQKFLYLLLLLLRVISWFRIRDKTNQLSSLIMAAYEWLLVDLLSLIYNLTWLVFLTRKHYGQVTTTAGHIFELNVLLTSIINTISFIIIVMMQYIHNQYIKTFFLDVIKNQIISYSVCLCDNWKILRKTTITF